MENKKRKHSLLNVFDIVVIIAAIILFGIFIIPKNESPSEEAPKTRPVRYKVELTGMVNDSAKLVMPGDKLADKLNRYSIGEVVSVEVKPTVTYSTDAVNGRIISAEIPGNTTAEVVIVAEAVETDTEIIIDGGYVIRVGLPVNIKGPGYCGTGYIIEVERD